MLKPEERKQEIEDNVLRERDDVLQKTALLTAVYRLDSCEEDPRTDNTIITELAGEAGVTHPSISVTQDQEGNYILNYYRVKEIRNPFVNPTRHQTATISKTLSRYSVVSQVDAMKNDVKSEQDVLRYMSLLNESSFCNRFLLDANIVNLGSVAETCIIPHEGAHTQRIIDNFNAYVEYEKMQGNPGLINFNTITFADLIERPEEIRNIVEEIKKDKQFEEGIFIDPGYYVINEYERLEYVDTLEQKLKKERLRAEKLQSKLP
jgi:hypothetical protein